jgi:DNA polymerase-3 subunit delta
VRKTAVHAFKIIESDLSGGAPFDARAVLLFGEEGYLVDHYERVIRSGRVSAGAEAVDFSRIYWEAKDISGTVSGVIAACETLPMMSERRVVVVTVSPGDEKSLGQTEVKPLARYVESAPETVVLIVKAASVPKNSALYKAFSSCGKAYEFGRLDRADLAAFIRGRFKRQGIAAPSDVVSEIINVSGYLDREPNSDLFRLGSDVENIAAHSRGAGSAGTSPEGDGAAAAGQSGVGGGGPHSVTMADVAACMGTSMETDVFAMLDAVSAGRKGDSIELIRNITSRGGNTFGLLALLTGQFEIMLGYKEMRNRHASEGEMMEALGVKSSYRLKKAAGFADKYSAERIAGMLHKLYRVDRDIKSGLYNERLALTMFVAGM